MIKLQPAGRKGQWATKNSLYQCIKCLQTRERRPEEARATVEVLSRRLLPRDGKRITLAHSSPPVVTPLWNMDRSRGSERGRELCERKTVQRGSSAFSAFQRTLETTATW